MLVAWTPSVEEGARFLAGQIRTSDRVVTIGAGDVDRAAGALLETLG
jgi:UDP-N-acetylmuramate-alanine ligase